MPYTDMGAVFLFIIQSSLMIGAAYGGISLIAASAVLCFSHGKRLPSLIALMIGSVLLFPAIWYLCIYYIYFADMVTRSIVAAVFSALVLGFDILIIFKCINQKKNKPTEEQI